MWVEILNWSGGLAGIATIVWWIINIRSKRKEAAAEADMKVAQADTIVGDNWSKYSERLENRISKLEQDFDELTKEIADERENRHNAEFFYCSKSFCEEREPALGTYAKRGKNV